MFSPVRQHDDQEEAQRQLVPFSIESIGQCAHLRVPFRGFRQAKP
jgi:hypothetical protein